MRSFSVPTYLDRLVDDLREVEVHLLSKDQEPPSLSGSPAPWRPSSLSKALSSSPSTGTHVWEGADVWIPSRQDVDDMPLTFDDDDGEGYDVDYEQGSLPRSAPSSSSQYYLPFVDEEEARMMPMVHSPVPTRLEPAAMPSLPSISSLASLASLPVPTPLPVLDEDHDGEKSHTNLDASHSTFECSPEQERAIQVVNALSGLLTPSAPTPTAKVTTPDEVNPREGTTKDEFPALTRKEHVLAASVATESLTNTIPSQPEHPFSGLDSEFSDHFHLLKKNDRALSLPIMRRKSSLKKVSSASSGSKSGSGMSRNVSFGKLETREYSIALSDHPSCSYGPPISLGWDFKDKQAESVDEYEQKRRPRRRMEQMILSYNVRRYLLLKRAGYTKSELREAMEEVERVKRDRMVTDMFLPVSILDETMEDIVTKVRDIFQPSGPQKPV